MSDAPITNPRVVPAHATRRHDAVRSVSYADIPEAATGPFRGIVLAVAVALPLWTALLVLAHRLV
jgi:hypothetical protein